VAIRRVSKMVVIVEMDEEAVETNCGVSPLRGGR
jgi:hypothetical protein